MNSGIKENRKGVNMSYCRKGKCSDVNMIIKLYKIERKKYKLLQKGEYMFELECDLITRLKIFFTGKIKIDRNTCIVMQKKLNKILKSENIYIPQFTTTGEIEYMTKEEIEDKESVQNYE